MKDFILNFFFQPICRKPLRRQKCLSCLSTLPSCILTQKSRELIWKMKKFDAKQEWDSNYRLQVFGTSAETRYQMSYRRAFWDDLLLKIYKKIRFTLSAPNSICVRESTFSELYAFAIDIFSNFTFHFQLSEDTQWYNHPNWKDKSRPSHKVWPIRCRMVH